MEAKYNYQVRVTGILIENGELLIVKQKLSEKRLWSLPGGRLEQNETIGQAIIRGMMEETGLNVKILKLLYLCDVPGMRPIIHLSFLLKKVNGEITMPSNEYDENPITDVRFVNINELGLYGFSQEFIQRIENGFPDAGNYVGSKNNIGLGI